MELRRPKLEDKEKILEMLADFEAAGSRQDGFFGGADFVLLRSEERRVGKECRSRWSPYH